jgi:hypothetical protein
MDRKLKINAIQKFTTVANRAGYYARCEVQDMNDGTVALVFLATPHEAAFSDYFTPENMDSELWKLADRAMYEFLSTEDFSKNKVFYFEWMADNKFYKLSDKPTWVD